MDRNENEESPYVKLRTFSKQEVLDSLDEKIEEFKNTLSVCEETQSRGMVSYWQGKVHGLKVAREILNRLEEAE